MSELKQIDESLNSLDRIFGFVYLYLTRPIFQKFGDEGEIAIREGLRAFGRFRGEYLRKWHTEEKLPINMESLLRFWDISSVRTSGCYTEDAIFTPYYVEHPATHCGLFEVCKEAGFAHYGYTYCDEVHQEICMAYQPKASVEIHENLMKGDPRCLFKWMMRPEIPENQIDKSPYEVLEKRWKEAPVENALFYLKRDVYVLGILYYFLADAIIKKFGDKGKRLIKSSLIDIGNRRGMELRQKLRRKGQKLHWADILYQFDLPYTQFWKIKTESSNGRLRADVAYCPLAEIWNQLGNKELGAMYCHTMYASMFRNLSPKARIKIPQCITEGARNCRFNFSI